MPHYAGQANFKKTGMTMYQQRWRSKRLLRGYHGDWIREKKFKRWYLPVDLPRLQSNVKVNRGREASGEENMPVASLFLREVERRLDTVVFRCCFARSAREARSLVLQGKVKVNGTQIKLPGTLLNPGDLLSVEPEAIPMLNKDLHKQAEMRAAARMSRGEEVNLETGEEGQEDVEASKKEEVVSTGETSVEGSVETIVKEDNIGAEASTSSDTTKDETEVEKVEQSGEEPASMPAEPKQGKGKSKQSSQSAKRREETLLPGQLPFQLPAYATPFLFIPPYMEVSFPTCSAIYMRHPTITPVSSPSSLRSTSSVMFESDIPSPYPASGDLFSLAWEHYARNSPRIRSDLRRLKMDAKVGRDGMRSARAKDEWKKVIAIRRGHDKKSGGKSEFVVGALRRRTRERASRPNRILEKVQARGKGASEARV